MTKKQKKNEDKKDEMINKEGDEDKVVDKGNKEG